MHAAAITFLLALTSPLAVDTLVVTPPLFEQALQPWIEHRQKQGHEIAIVRAADDAETIRDRLRSAAEGAAVKFVVLVGDHDWIGQEDEAYRRRALPTFYETSKVVVHYGSQKTIASDHRFGDLNDDGVPEVAVGRIAVDTPEELTSVIDKIIAYERSVDDGWQRKIHFIAGASGIGPLADTAIEGATRSLLRDHIPSGFATTMTYANWQSPYCPDPAEFRAAAIRRFNEGGLFWVYLGHGHVQLVDLFEVPGDRHPVFDVHAMPRLQRQSSSPIAMFFACYTGAFDARNDCLAEEMLKAPGGPAAVIAATRVTMPYAMSVLGLAMMDEYFRHRCTTIGELLLAAKRNSVLASRTDSRSQMLDGMAKLLNPFGPDLSDERREHLLLFHLLGDPLLRLPHCAEAQLAVPEQVEAGRWLDVTGAAPIDGPAEVDLAVRRDRFNHEFPTRAEFATSDAARAEFQKVYNEANEQRLSRQLVTVAGGRFQTRLWVPADAKGECHVRVYVAGQYRSAIGSRDVQVINATTRVSSNADNSPKTR